jgi:3-oxoacyl-[acyl-carrier-protein] synthase III
MKTESRDVYLRAVGANVPDNIWSNDRICDALGFPREKGEKYGGLLGVSSRPLCVDYEQGGKQILAGEDLAAGAARDALERAELAPTDVDVLITASSFFDYMCPPLSSRLLKRLGIETAQTFDLIGGCAEFLHGIRVGANMIQLGQADEVLICASEVINAWWAQTRFAIEHFIFGDTGGAMVLSSSRGTHRLVASELKTVSHVMGEPAELICVPILGGKTAVPLFYDDPKVDKAVLSNSDIRPENRLVHNIKQVAVGAPMAMVSATQCVLDRAKVAPEQTFLVPHQASAGVLSALTQTGVPQDQIGISIATRGNMSTCSIPVTLRDHYERAVDLPYLTMTSVGVGMSFGAMLWKAEGRA